MALIPLDSAYRKFEEWTQQYGPIFSLRQGFSTTIVIGRMQAAIDVMERDGAWLARRDLSMRANGTIDTWYGCLIYDEMIDYALNFSAPWSASFSHVLSAGRGG